MTDADQVPRPSLGAPPQSVADIRIVGNEAVEMLDDLVTNLSGASDRKGAVLVMIGLLHSAIGKTLLVQEGNSPAQAVLNLWK